METRKAVSNIVWLLVVVIVLLSAALLVMWLTNNIFSGAGENTGNIIDQNQNASRCNAIRTQCNLKCESICGTTDSPGDLTVEFDGEELECGSDQYGCTTDWQCVCG